MTKQQKTITSLFLIAISMSGCMTFEGPDHKYVLTQEGFKEVTKQSDNNQSTRSSGNQSKGKKEESSPKNKAGSYGLVDLRKGTDPVPMSEFEFVYSRDIDSSYNKLKEEFGFVSLQDISTNKYHHDAVKNNGLLHRRYEAMPGVHYKMRNWVHHDFNNEEPENTIQVELSKDGPEKVLIQVSYYSGSISDVPGYEKSLKARIEKALQ